MAQNQVKFPVPRQLEENETVVTLGQWKNQFTIYAKRDPVFVTFLSVNWNSDQPNRGFVADNLQTAAAKAANCELFINHVSSFLKTPYWNKRILERTRNLADIWKIFDEIFGIESNADSFLDLSSMKYNGTESYSSFLQRIMFHIENHLPEGGITVDNIQSGETGEKMSIMLMDMATKDWMEKIHPSLIDRVKIDYGVQIKAGMRLSQLAPQISKAIPSILKKINSTKSDVIRALQDLDHEATEHTSPVYSMQYSRGGGNRNGANRGRNQFRNQRGGRGGPASQRGRTAPVCKHCKWLHDHWDIREIDYSHETRSCRRTMPPEVKFINEAPQDALDSAGGRRPRGPGGGRTDRRLPALPDHLQR